MSRTLIERESIRRRVPKVTATSTLDFVPASRTAQPCYDAWRAVWSRDFVPHTTTTLGGVWLVLESMSPPSADIEHTWGAGTQWSMFVTSLPDPRCEILSPFQVTITQIDQESFVAHFREANIAMAGETAAEAYENLLENLLDVFQLYGEEESSLGPDPARQLIVLRKYLARRQ